MIFSQIQKQSAFKTVGQFELQSTNMLPLLFPLFLLLATAQILLNSCSANYKGLLLTGTITLRTDAGLSSKESETFNYSLSSTFKAVPEVALAFSALQSQSSPYLMLSLKPLPSSLSTLSFFLRLHSRYTTWSFITFRFLAEERTDIESNYYELDTRELAIPQPGKVLQVRLPFLSNFTNSSVAYFLHGIELGTDNSPFEIQITKIRKSNVDLQLVLSVTSTTQIYALLLSYVLYDTNQPLFSSGIYSSEGSSASFLSIPLKLPNTQAIFDGISDFVISNVDGRLQIGGQIMNGSLHLESQPAADHISYQWWTLALPTSPCFFCQSAPFSYLGTCLPNCPNNTIPLQDQCVECTPDTQWNGSQCVSRCLGGRKWSSATATCDCTVGLNWNGVGCLSCSNGQIWDAATLSCICSVGSNWTGTQCLTCFSGSTYDPSTLTCNCGINSAWNGSTCVTICPPPFVYTTGQCECPAGTYRSQDSCSPIPICPTGSTWNGTNCAAITCNAGSIWDGSTCISTAPTCPPSTYWSGSLCQPVALQCPNGSQWDGSSCRGGSCVNGYWNGSQCRPFSQQCPYSYEWNGTACAYVGTAAGCQPSEYFNGLGCITFSCSGGQFWNKTVMQCQCPVSSFWNGNICVSCAAGLVYLQGNCRCPDGYFLIQNACYSLQQNYCSLVSNSKWDGSTCGCNAGFAAVGLNCVCSGLLVGSGCDICYDKPYSQWSRGSCECIQGYYRSEGTCKPLPPVSNLAKIKCNPGTVADVSRGICLPCPDGCLSCLNPRLCLQCRPEYNYDWSVNLCRQICGDGLRFTLPCDDGNNRNGDGCTSDCNVEGGYTCTGGSPNAVDVCSQWKPAKIELSMTGTTHLMGKIVVNVRSNYLPATLTNPAVPCLALCKDILVLELVSGFTSSVSITSTFLVSPGLSFAVEIEFGVEPIGAFQLQAGINPSVGAIYFSGIDYSPVFTFSINPAFLSIYQPSEALV